MNNKNKLIIIKFILGILFVLSSIVNCTIIDEQRGNNGAIENRDETNSKKSDTLEYT